MKKCILILQKGKINNFNIFSNDSSTSPLFNIRYEVIKNRLNK